MDTSCVACDRTCARWAPARRCSSLPGSSPLCEWFDCCGFIKPPRTRGVQARQDRRRPVGCGPNQPLPDVATFGTRSTHHSAAGQGAVERCSPRVPNVLIRVVDERQRHCDGLHHPAHDEVLPRSTRPPTFRCDSSVSSFSSCRVSFLLRFDAKDLWFSLCFAACQLRHVAFACRPHQMIGRDEW